MDPFFDRGDRAEVVELFPTLSEQDKIRQASPVQLDHERELGGCYHRLTRLDMQSRRVYCRECDAEVPAFDVLVELSRRLEYYLSVWERARSGAERAQELLAGLERREANTKARIRRAKKKAGPTPLQVAEHVLHAAWLTGISHRTKRREPGREVMAWLRKLAEPAEDNAEHALHMIAHKFEAIARRAEAAEETAEIREFEPPKAVG